MWSFIQDAARRLGIEIIPAWRMVRRPFADHLCKLFERFGVTCVLDVGANVGQYGDFLRREVGYQGLIISFEPVKDVFDILERHARNDRNWRVLNVALGSQEATCMMHVATASEFSSLHAPRPTGRQFKRNVVVRSENVSLRRLDRVVQELPASLPMDHVYLKTDTQGHDLEVIQGAGQFLDRVMALQAEMAVDPVYEGAPDFVETLRILRSKRFEISAMFPVAVDGDMRLVEFDCVMINRASVAGARVLEVPASPTEVGK